MGKIALKVVHWIILLNFITGAAYAGFMVFSITPEGGGGPLFGRATEMPIEMMVTRRLYALEFWVAFSGLAIYLGLTEMLPRWIKRPE